MEQEYGTVKLTKEEFELLIKIKNQIAHKGLPVETFSVVNAKDINDYLEKMHRESLVTGALVGIGLVALLYLLTKK